ncbi:MAG: TonB family protein [Treponema sp.]|jgi:protein TonB|nr:TonB family protein [Treponema sp.]
MAHEKKLRLLLFAAVAGLHVLLLLFFAFNVRAAAQAAPEDARIMKLTDLAEEIPPPPPLPPPPPPPPSPPASEELPVVESIAENMIATETPPEQTVIAPLTAVTPVPVNPSEEYLPIHRVSEAPKFDENEIAAAVVYPEIARRSGIEGRVILELFVDRSGQVRQIRILQETPPNRGFGEAAINAFTGRRGIPAQANGEPVATRYRYPVTFRLN